MTVWINNPFDNLPFEGFRPQRYWLIAQAFERAGHSVVLWSSDWSHANKRRRMLDEDQMAQASGNIGPNAHLILIPTPAYRRHISLRRLRSHYIYAKNWQRMALRMVSKGMLSKPDVIITSLPPLSIGLAALELRGKWGSKIICDIQDAWPETFYRALPGPKRFRDILGSVLFKHFHSMAKRVYMKADAVTAVARRYLKLARDYGALSPTRLCYHGIKLPPHFDSQDSQPRRQFFKGQRNCYLVYIGNMAKTYDLGTVIKAVRETPGVELHLAGGGPEEQELRLKTKGCPRIFFHGYLRAAAMNTLLASADAGIIPMFENSCVVVPCKIGDYAAAGLPVINSLGGETEMLLANYDAGFKYEAGSVQSFKDALAKLMSAPERLPAMRLRMRDMARTEFDAIPIYDAYMEFVEGLSPRTIQTAPRSPKVTSRDVDYLFSGANDYLI